MMRGPIRACGSRRSVQGAQELGTALPLAELLAFADALDLVSAALPAAAGVTDPAAQRAILGLLWSAS
jgi:hypothetical protein